MDKKQFSFIGLDGVSYIFKCERNTLNNNMMWTINEWRDCYAGTMKDVNSVIREIKKNCKVEG